MPTDAVNHSVLPSNSMLDDELLEVSVTAPLEGRAEVIRRLLAKGASPNARKTLWGLPVWAHIACSLHVPSLEPMIAAGADLNAIFRVPNPHEEGDACRIMHVLANPRQCSAALGLQPMLERLVRGGVSPNVRNSADRVPLNIALQHASVPGLKAFVRVGADPNVVDVEGNNLLHQLAASAARFSRGSEGAALFQQLAGALMELQVDPRHSNVRGLTVLEAFDNLPKTFQDQPKIQVVIKQVETTIRARIIADEARALAETEAKRPAMYDSRWASRAH